MIKILFSLPALHGGGAERVVLNLARNLDRGLFSPDVFLMKRKGVYWNEVPSHVNVFLGTDKNRIRNAPISIIREYLAIAKSYDILVGGLELEPTYLAWAAGAIYKKPSVGWVHIALGEYLKHQARWHRVAASRIYPRLDRIVCLADGSAASLMKLATVRAGQLRIMPYPFDAAKLESQKAAAPPPWDNGHKDLPVLVACGRLTFQKGFDVLIEAHKLVKMGGINHELWILGEGPMREHLSALADRNGVSDSVVLPGFLENPYPAIRSAQIFVLSSRFEGLPLVILESLALGTPIIATDCVSGPAELLDNGKYGVLVPPGDAVALAEAITGLLRDADRRHQFSQTGKYRAAQYYPEQVVSSWEKLFVELHCGRSQKSA